MSFEPGGSGPEPLRLFFAVWPAADSLGSLQREIVRLRGRVQASWARSENLHLTLCFLGAVPRFRVDSLVALNVAVPDPFDVCFDRLRFLRRRRMLWLESSGPNPVLKELVGRIEARLDDLGQARDRRPFHAHLTLARKVRGDCNPDELPEPVLWCVRGFDLVVSDPGRTGVLYRSLCHWPLHTTPADTSVE